MIHPDTELRFAGKDVGVGVFATALIRKGTIVWILDDLDIRLTRSQVMALEPLRRDVVLRFAYPDVGDTYVLCWDHGRYVNHSFVPNMAPTRYGFELAARDIQPDEELRTDYALIAPSLPFTCAPEDGTFRTRLMDDDYLYSIERWDDMAKDAFRSFNLVDQPLRHLIRPELVPVVSAIASGKTAPESFAVLRGGQGF